MSSWGCPHEIDGKCQRVLNRPCDIGMKGCVLFGRFKFADPSKNRPPKTPAAPGAPMTEPHDHAAQRNMEVIYADKFLIVVNKPAGLLAVPGRGPDKQDCLSVHVQQQFADALIVHRLDMSTSGLMLFARGSAMQRELSHLFHERLVDKRYLAVVSGVPAAASGEIDLPIAADWPRRPLRKIDAASGQPALTRYRVLAHEAQGSRVELEPITGRTHQLRVHLAAIGHPILGDALYGDAASAPRLLLHACMLGFVHPRSGAALQFASPAPF